MRVYAERGRQNFGSGGVELLVKCCHGRRPAILPTWQRRTRMFVSPSRGLVPMGHHESRMKRDSLGTADRPAPDVTPGHAGSHGLEFDVLEVPSEPHRIVLEPARSTIVLHDGGGRVCRIRHGEATTRFVSSSGRIDFISADIGDELASEGPACRLIVVYIPRDFEAALFEEGSGPIAASARYQFNDRRLERLMRLLSRGTTEGLSAADSTLLSVAIADRVQEACGLQLPNRGQALSIVIKRLVADYIEQYIGLVVDTQRLGSLVGLSRSQFALMFRASFGTSIYQYVLARRIDAAQKRLKTEISVGELAYDLGFSSPSHFSTVFRQHVGLSPREFQRKRSFEVS